MASAPEARRALHQGLLAALLGTGLFFLLFEVLLRLVGYDPEDTPYGYDPDLLGDFLADKRHMALHPHPADHTPYRFDTNAQGLRADRDYAVPKPAGVRRVRPLQVQPCLPKKVREGERRSEGAACAASRCSRACASSLILLR